MLTNRRSTMAILPSATQNLNAAIDQTTTEPHSRETSALTATIATLPGYRVIRVVGAVHGMTVCSRKDTKSFLKSVGTASEARALTHTLYAARDTATERMIKDCISRGGNAVIGMGYGESEILGFAQVSVHGTAVFVEKPSESEILS